jgi:hypothetical protein
MKNFWKWFVGILLGLLVLAIVVGLPLAVHYGRTAWLDDGRVVLNWGPSDSGWMHNRGGMPMAFGRGSVGLMPWGGMLLGGLLQLGLLVLMAAGIVWIVRAIRAQGIPARSCTKCGRAVQDDWKVCPHCASKL